MAENSLIKIKRSNVAGNAPDTNNIVEGELALNTNDKILYSRGGDTIFEVGANVSSLSIGGTEVIDSSGVWQGSPDGIKGAKGATGIKGAKGATGIKGAKGATGLKGIKGAKGATGLKGIKGATGLKGIKGASGATGTKGAKGATGVKGQQGNFGGTSFEYSFTEQTTTTGPGAGYFKILNNNALSAGSIKIDDEDKSGNDIQAFLRTMDDSTSSIKGHLKISQKDDSGSYVLYEITAVSEETTHFTVSVNGVSGTTGSGSLDASKDYIISFTRTGDKGVSGIKGAKGATGIKGAKGATGIKGAKGATGIKGAKGATGIKGTSGIKGAKGATGLKGAKGATGVKGDGFDTATHISPTNGSLGTDGYRSIAGDGKYLGLITKNSYKFARNFVSTSSSSTTPTDGQVLWNDINVAGTAILRLAHRLASASTEEDKVSNVVQYDHVFIRSVDDKDKYFFGRLDSVVRTSGSSNRYIQFTVYESYSDYNVEGHTTETGFAAKLNDAFAGDDVEIYYIGQAATTTLGENGGSLVIGNSLLANQSKICLNAFYDATAVQHYYPLDIGTINNYHGDLSSTYRSMCFQTQSSLQGFVWRYATANGSYGAGMTLRSDGKLNVAYGIRVGAGINDTADVTSTYRLYVSGQIYSTSNISAYSDKRAKENIKPITDGLDKVLKLEGVYYNMKEGHAPNEDHTRPRIGVLAQDVQKILPQVVTYAEEEDKYSVDYGNITAVLIEAIKDQHKIIESLSERIDKLEKR